VPGQAGFGVAEWNQRFHETFIGFWAIELEAALRNTSGSAYERYHVAWCGAYSFCQIDH
jgi:hypothetical protein